MSISELWTNNDGLQVRFGREGNAYNRTKTTLVTVHGNENELTVDFSWDNMPGFDADADNDGVLESFDKVNEHIPANAIIKEAVVYATEDWTGTGTPTMSIGLYEADGTVIDADGIDAAIAEGALDANDVVVCDGALASHASVGANDAYVRVYPAAGTYTAGKARLVVRFVLNQ